MTASALSGKLALAVVLVSLGALVGGGLVWARGAADDITACVEPRTGYLVYGRSCGGASLTWGQQGPAGPAGPQGAAGVKGDPAKGIEPPSPAEIQFVKHPPKRLTAVPAKPNLAKLARLTPSLGHAGVLALSSFHDENVPMGPGLFAPPKIVAHLDVPAGRYVVVAKALSWSDDYDTYVFSSCSLVAGVDSDLGTVNGRGMISLTVVHTFGKPGRIDLRCAGFLTDVSNAKITAIRVDVLKNAHVAAG